MVLGRGSSENAGAVAPGIISCSDGIAHPKESNKSVIFGALSNGRRQNLMNYLYNFFGSTVVQYVQYGTVQL